MATINWSQEPKVFREVPRRKGRRASWLVIAGLLAGVMAAAGQGTPDYSGSSTSVSIPFANSQSQSLCFTDQPQLVAKVSIVPGQNAQPLQTKPMSFPMDTGSTGILISPDMIPGYRPVSGRPGYQFYSSSNRLSVGNWVEATVTFYKDVSGNAETAIASVPVLVVEQTGICPHYAGGNTCPDGTLQRPTGVAYMGVGFGQEGDSMPQGTPEKNPLLHLTTIDGKSIAPGYIIESSGVTVGLTPANTQGFGFIKLSRYASPYQNDWEPVSMCVQINSSPCYSGTALVDTGVSKSYITIPHPLPSEDIDRLVPPGALITGTKVTVKLPAPDPNSAQSNPVVSYGYEVGGKKGLPEPQVIPNWPPANGQPTQRNSSTNDWTPFVNTGRRFLQEYQFLYDAQNGYVGLRPQPSTKSCGPRTATATESKKGSSR